MRLVRLARIVALTAFVLRIDGFAGAQTNTGEISGIVRDSQGGVLPGATVQAEHVESGIRIERLSDERGYYLLPGLRLGRYTLAVSLPGFKAVVRSVSVELGQRLSVDVSLEVGGVTEEVRVSAEPPLLQATSAEISDVINNQQVVEIPLNGRNFLGLAQLSDAVVIPPGGTRGDALQQAGPLPNVGGQRSGHNIYLLDGFKVTDELFNNLVINPSVDSIQEFKIQKSQYAAEFGGKASALINVATRSGANAIHGSGFEFLRDDAFDARNYFDQPDQPVPPLRQHQFGGAVGGPVVHDRTFYFGSYEGQRMRRSLTRTFSVPPLAVRGGDFSGVASICDPLTRDRNTGACSTFAGNRIPSDRLDPLAIAFLRHVPLPTSDEQVQNLVAVGRQDKDVDQLSIRVDHRLSQADQLFVRISSFDARELQPFGTSSMQETLIPGFGRRLDTVARNVGVSHTRTFGTSWLNELRLGWMAVRGGQRSVNRGVDFAGDVGLQGVTRDARDVGFPQISTRGFYSTMGDPTSFIYRDNSHLELYENVLVSKGAHRLKFGAYAFRLRLRPEQPDNARGAFTYTGQFSGNAFADFLLGYPASAVSGIGRGEEDGHTTWVHVFAQDDWRLRQNLTLNLGLRYEHNGHMRDAQNRLSSFDVGRGRFIVASDESGAIHPDAYLLLPSMPLPYVTSEEAGWSPTLLQPSRVRLAPRSGFALTLKDGRAVVRGGYGIFLNQWAYSVQTAFARNLPFFYTRQVDVPVDAREPSFQTRNILLQDPTGVVSPTIMDHDYRVEYTQTWSGGLQYELFPSTMTEISYMGSWTLGADNPMLYNVPEPGPGSIQVRRSLPELGVIRSIRFNGKSIYHAVTLKAERRLRDHVSVNASYTLSTSKDDASSPGPTEAESNNPQNVKNIFSPAGEWARSSFEHRHMLVASGTYELRGWRFNAVFSAQSGAPFTVNLGVDQANVGSGPAQRPNQLRNPNLGSDARTPDRWFDTSAFALPTVFTFGSAPRNSVLGPGAATLDTAVAKTVRLSSATHLELRWEVFNLLNRANFDLPDRIFGTPNFGRIFSAKNPREMQLGMKLLF